MLYRKRLLAQGNYYIKQNLSDNDIPTIEQLTDMLNNDAYSNIMQDVEPSDLVIIFVILDVLSRITFVSFS